VVQLLNTSADDERTVLDLNGAYTPANIGLIALWRAWGLTPRPLHKGQGVGHKG